MQLRHIWKPEFPESLYKYMHHKYAAALCREGALLLRGLESYPDHEEGKRFMEIDNVSYDDIYANDSNANIVQSNLQGFLKMEPSAVGSRVTNCTAVSQTGNFLVFCASIACSSFTMRACCPEYDTCVRIRPVAKFTQYLTRHLAAVHAKDADLICYAGQCRCHERTFNVRSEPRARNQEIAFVKTPEYALEREYRLLWTALCPEGMALPVKCGELRDVCQIVNP